jgi:hypothetical protein
MGRIPFYCAAALASLCGLTLSSMQAQEGNDLRTPSAFSEITDTTARSRALFGEMAKVIMHPRCMNCHPAGDRPTQGNDMHPHMPPVWRAAGLCLSCHTQGNYTLHERATYRSIQDIFAGMWHRLKWRGRIKPRARFASSSKTPRETEGEPSHSCTSILRTMISWHGAGIPARVAIGSWDLRAAR